MLLCVILGLQCNFERENKKSTFDKPKWDAENRKA